MCVYDAFKVYRENSSVIKSQTQIRIQENFNLAGNILSGWIKAVSPVDVSAWVQRGMLC